jgi:hypothetical protein
MTRSSLALCWLVALAAGADAQTLGTATYHIDFGNGSSERGLFFSGVQLRSACSVD